MSSANNQPTEWSIWCVTYNVGMQKATASAVEELMAPIKEQPRDIIVVGMQDNPVETFRDVIDTLIVKLKTKYRPFFETHLKYLEVAHGETLGGTLMTWQSEVADWLAIHDGTVTMIGKTFQATNQISVFVSKRLLPKIRSIAFRYARNTMGGLTGHKGSIGVNLKLKDFTSIVFVVSHFVHDVSQFDRRILQYNDNKGCAFLEDRDVKYIIWMGDLNFRIEDDADIVAEAIVQGKLDSLLEKDQLSRARAQKLAFLGYQEASINFPPTYRLTMGTTKYDLKRTPSWCDRILFRGSGLKCDLYCSMPTVKASDHLPVQGSFTARIPLTATNLAVDWDVQFEHLPTWYTSIPVTSRFKMKKDYWSKRGAYMDWIAVYPATMNDVTSPVRWVYMMTCYEQSLNNETWNVAELPSLPPGDYRFGYHSTNSNCLVGLGKSFKVIQAPDLMQNGS